MTVSPKMVSTRNFGLNWRIWCPKNFRFAGFIPNEETIPFPPRSPRVYQELFYNLDNLKKIAAVLAAINGN